MADTPAIRHDALAKVLKALAHPSRIMMVEELGHGQRCVCELQQMVGADISTVSKHLSVLKNAGLVKDEKRGLQVFYRLHCPCVLQFVSCIEQVIETNAKEATAAACCRK